MIKSNILEDNFEFVITGPPRSGSAFISTFLSFGNESCCWHEPFASNKEFHSNENTTLTGAACSSFGVATLDYFESYDRPKLFLSRDLDECFSSWNSQYTPLVDQFHLEFFRRSYSIASSSCEHSFDITKDMSIQSLKRVWEHLMPSIKFSERWANHCILMQIKLKSLKY